MSVSALALGLSNAGIGLAEFVDGDGPNLVARLDVVGGQLADRADEFAVYVQFTQLEDGKHELENAEHVVEFGRVDVVEFDLRTS